MGLFPANQIDGIEPDAAWVVHWLFAERWTVAGLPIGTWFAKPCQPPSPIGRDNDRSRIVAGGIMVPDE